jgi:hypothetical protein
MPGLRGLAEDGCQFLKAWDDQGDDFDILQQLLDLDKNPGANKKLIERRRRGHHPQHKIRIYDPACPRVLYVTKKKFQPNCSHIISFEAPRLLHYAEGTHGSWEKSNKD